MLASDHYACPGCGIKYQPWAGMLGKRKNIPAIEAQKVVRYVNADGVTKAFPMRWPDSATDRWLNRLLEDRAVHQGVVDPENVVSIAARTLSEIDAKLSKFRPVQFRHFPWRMSVQDRLNPNDYPRSQWEHLVERGFYGEFLEDMSSPDLEIFDETSDVIGLFANVVGCGLQMAKGSTP